MFDRPRPGSLRLLAAGLLLSCLTGCAPGVVALALTLDKGKSRSPSASPRSTVPAATPLSLSLLEDTSLPIALQGSDPLGRPLSYRLVSRPESGSLEGVPPFLTFRPAPDANGTFTFEYVVNNGIEDSSPAQVQLEVAPVNDAPSFLAGPGQNPDPRSKSQTVPSWARGISAGPSDEIGQSLTFETSTTNPALFATQPQVSATGDLTFTLAAVAGIATVSVVLRDGGGVAAGGEDSSTAQTFTVTIADVAPVLSFSRGQWIDAPMAEELIFDVEAVDFNGEVLDLRLLNPPPGCVFDPLPLSAGPLRARFRWRVPKETPGLRQLYFQSRSGTHTTTSAVTIQAASFLGLTSSNYLTGDVTGDGVLDLVGVGSYVDAATSTDVGAIYVWAGSSTPQGNPTATLRHGAPQNGDRLGHAGSMQGVFLVDLTGDGVLDVVAGGSLVDAPGPVPDAGAVFVWAGGSTLTGSPTPLATLRRPTPVAFDQLGDVHGGQGILFGDVTGDGRLDLIVGSDSLDAPGPIRDVGGALVWAGGNGLVGSPAPYAELFHPSPTTGDRLTYGGISQSLVLGDVTGDGILDVLLGGRWLDLGGVFDSGGGFLWAGGPALAGRPSPTATLRRVTPSSGDDLGSVGGAMFTLGDVTHDGVLDVLIGGSSVSAGTNRSGAVYLWAGGAALTGTPPPTATLQNPELDSFAYLGNVRTSGALIVADLTGDERLDVLVAGSRLDAPGSGGPSHVGGAFLWSGGAGLSGTPAPTAALRHPNPRFGDELGFAAGGGGTQVADLTGDGVLDVILVGSDVSTASVSKA